MGWLDRLLFWRDRSDDTADRAASTVGESEVEGCFTLPDATLDDMRRAAPQRADRGDTTD